MTEPSNAIYNRYLISLALTVGFFPLVSLAISVLIAFAPLEFQNEESLKESWRLIVLVIALLMFLAKVLAIVGNLLKWYYGWLYHQLELHFIVFLLGLFLVISTFIQTYTFLGLFKLLGLFLIFVANFHLRILWSCREIRDNYKVTFYTHA